ncbi:hypothetical protein AAMO2058_001251300 [Amorphochlora amoebiformis]
MDGSNRPVLRKVVSHMDGYVLFQRAIAVRQYVLGVVEGIFLKYGAVSSPAPLLRPMLSGDVAFDKGSAVMIDKLGRQVLLPFSLTVPFARFLAHKYRDEIAAGTAEPKIRRFESGRVYRETPQGVPKELFQCSYDSAWVSTAGSRQRSGALESAEAIGVADDILQAFALDGVMDRVVVYLSHVEIVRALARSALTRGGQEVKMDTIQALARTIAAHCARERIGTGTGRIPWGSSRLCRYLRKSKTFNHILKEEGLKRIGDALNLFSPVADSTLTTDNLRRLKILLRPPKKSRKKKKKRKKRTGGDLKSGDSSKDGWELRVRNAIENLENVVRWLRVLRKGTNVVIDPGLSLASPIFNSGVIFQACSYNIKGGDNIIAIGGRYDRLLSSFKPPTLSASSASLKAVGLILAVEKLFQAVSLSDASFVPGIPPYTNIKALIYSRSGPTGAFEDRVRLAANLRESGIGGVFRYPPRLGDLGQVRQVRRYCRDARIRWIVEVRDHSNSVRVRDSQTQQGPHDVKDSVLPQWLLNQGSGHGLARGSSIDNKSIGKVIANSPRKVPVQPRLSLINPRHQKEATINHAVCRVLRRIGITGEPLVVAVNLPFLEIRRLMSSVMAGESEAQIVPKGSTKPSDPRRLLVKEILRMKHNPPPNLFVYSISEGMLDTVQL